MFQKSNYIILFSIICLLIFLLGLTDNWVTINLLILVVCLLSLVFDRIFILFLYIIFLPTNGIIGADYNLFGLLNLQQLLNSFAIIVLVKESWNYKVNADGFTRFAIAILVFFLLYSLFTEIKNYYFSLYETTAKVLVTRSIKYFLLFGSSILLCRIIKNEKIQELFEFSVIVSIVFLSISHIFSLELFKIGFHTRGVFTAHYGMSSTSFGRSSGFFENGDQNSFGTFLAIAAGYFCSKTEGNINRFSKLTPILVLISICVVLTLSRTAIAAFLFVLVYFWYRNIRSIKTILYAMVFVFSIIVVLQYTDFFSGVISRFSTTSSEFTRSDESTRHFKWLYYLNYIFSDLRNLIVGSKQMIFIDQELRAAHNLYITILFNAGIFFLGYILILYTKFYSFAIHQKNKYNLLYVVIPFFMITMLVSDWGCLFYLVFFIALNEKIVQPTFQSETGV